jgi:Cu/Ag efflux protein CusF
MKHYFVVAGLVVAALGLGKPSDVYAVSQPAATSAPEMVDAEVKKVDKDAKKVTLKHAEIKRLDMPAMTMVFPVKDAAMLEKLKAGDKVKVNIEQSKGGYLVTAIEAAK